VLASSSTRLTRPAVDATSVYWGETTTGIVEKVAIDGGRAALVTSTSLATDLAITGALVVVADGYTLVSAPSAGGPATAIATAAGAPIFAVAADDTSVYFTSYGTIWKVAIDGGPATALASDQDSPGAIAVDQTSVYWTNEGGGQLMKLTPK